MIKLLVFPVLLLIVLVLLFGVYVAVVIGAVDIPVLSGAFRTTGEPLSPEVKARGQVVERKIETAAQDRSAFFLELTDQELTDLLRSRIDPRGQIRDLKVETQEGEIAFSGTLNGRVPVPFSGAAVLTVKDGKVQLDVKRFSLGFLPLPVAAQEEIQPILDRVLDLNKELSRSGAAVVQQVLLEQGKATIVGIQQEGKTVSDEAAVRFREAVAAADSRLAPEPPGGNVVPPGTVDGKTKIGDELYLALGDSLAANVGAPSPQEGYVSRFHGYLERQMRRPIGLRNLGVSGESSSSITEGQLRLALDEIEGRRDDGNPATKVSVLTLNLGANDLIGHVGSDDCLLAPAGAVCQARIDAGLATFGANFGEIASTLASEIEPATEFYIMTVYNPFDFGIGLPTEDFSNEIIERLNHIVRETAETHGAVVVDAYSLMNGNATAWTHVLTGDVHPNAAGYQVLAFSLVQARQRWQSAIGLAPPAAPTGQTVSGSG